MVVVLVVDSELLVRPFGAGLAVGRYRFTKFDLPLADGSVLDVAALYDADVRVVDAESAVLCFVRCCSAYIESQFM